MNKKEAYSILNLDSNASEDDAKKKYKELSKKYHPDICKDSDANDKFKKINEAYDAIKNNNFDDNQPSFGHGFSGSPFAGFNIQDLGDLFMSSMGGNRRQRKNLQPIGVNIHLSFKEAAFGCKKEISFDRMSKCQKCDGNGSIHQNNGCKTCNGVGRVTKVQGNMVMTQTCNSCGGRVKSIACDGCSSSGCVSSNVTVSINIPPGVFGNTLRLSGIGHYLGSSGFGDDYTDVYVHVSADEDDYFVVEEQDLVSAVNLTLAEALEGKNINIKTLEGDKEISIPKLSKNKDEIILPNLGIGRIGSQKIIINVSYPSNILDIISQIKELN